MSESPSDPVTELFHESNTQISGLVQALAQCCSEASPNISTADIAKLLAVLKCVQGAEPRLFWQAGYEGRQEVSEFQKHLERLIELLPDFHGKLLKERDRLEKERARLHAISEWNKRSRQTR